MFLNKLKAKFSSLNNRDRLIVCGAVSIIIMLVVGVIFKFIGLNSFIIESNINTDIDFKENIRFLLNSIMLWINGSFFLAFSLQEYSLKIIPKIIFSFPIIYCANFCYIWNYALVAFVLPFALVFIVKFDFKTILRFLFIYTTSAVVQFISGFIKTNIFSIRPCDNSKNPYLTLIFAIDIYIIYTLIMIIDKYKTIKINIRRGKKCQQE